MTSSDENDATLDPTATSWVPDANNPDADFPPQNLPFGVYAAGDGPHPCVAIGSRVLDLVELADAGLLEARAADALAGGLLNGLMELDVADRRRLRQRLFELVTRIDSDLGRNAGLQERALRPIERVQMLLPAAIGDYTDFYASLFHARNVGSMLRPDNPLLPNYKHIPIGYHGRASSVVVSGTPVRRPLGQTAPPQDGALPEFGPCRNLDYELELGVFVGRGNPLGEPIPLAHAETHLFGVVLVNDWSARDVQRWEYQPLGPFLSKSFATSISPWVVTWEALEPFRIPGSIRGAEDPQPLPYLHHPDNQRRGGIDVRFQVLLRTQAMRDAGLPPQAISHGRFADMYWTFAQMLTHHTSNGCNLRPGDLLASGTVSGAEREARGCLLELTWDGEFSKAVPGSQRTPLRLPSGETRIFLQDGDEVILRGWCERPGYRRIGLGECSGMVLPAHGAPV